MDITINQGIIMSMYDYEEYLNYGEYDEYEYEPVTCQYQEIVHETAKAYLFSINDKKYWVAKSICLELDKNLKQFEILGKYKLTAVQ